MEKEKYSPPETEPVSPGVQPLRPASGEVFVAHMEDTQPPLPVSPDAGVVAAHNPATDETAIRDALWQQLVRLRKDARVTQAAMARQIGVPAESISQMERGGPDSRSAATLQAYPDGLEGWVEPVTGPAPLSQAEVEGRAQAQRASRNSKRVRRAWDRETLQCLQAITDRALTPDEVATRTRLVQGRDADRTRSLASYHARAAQTPDTTKHRR